MAQLKAGRLAEARKNLEAALQGDQEYTGREEARTALEGL
jgi:Tfp pilus assembly protein PilF